MMPLKNICSKALLVSCVIAFFIIQQLTIIGSWTPVPFSDSWPAWYRYMDFEQHNIGMLKYIFAPHGSHLHSIVYLIYAIDGHVFDGMQLLPLLLSLVSSIIVDLVFVYMFYVCAKSKHITSTLCILATAAAIYFINAPSGANLHIFQVVLNASRAVFMLTLFVMIQAFRLNRDKWHIALLVIAAIATTFHGSGLIFAFIVALVYIILGRTVLQKAIGLTPLVFIIILNAFSIPSGSGELNGIIGKIFGFDVSQLRQMFVGISAYYATPFVRFWDNKMLFTMSQTIAIGSVVMATSVLYSTWVFFHLWPNWNKTNEQSASLFLAFANIFVLISALGSYFFWSARDALFNTNQIYENILFSSRYACFASLAYAQLAYISVACFIKSPKIYARYGAVGMLLFLVVAQQLFVENKENLSFRHDIEATRQLIDKSAPKHFLQDPFWKEKLTKLLNFMAERRLGFFSGLPRMEEKLEATPRTVVYDPQLAVLDDAENLCQLNATVAHIDQDIFHSPRILAIVDPYNNVIGYSAIIPDIGDSMKLIGTVKCPDPDIALNYHVALPKKH